MSIVWRGMPGLVVGALIGAFWWLAYVPSAHSLPLLVASHALAGGLLQGFTNLLVPRWRSTASTVLGLIGGFLVGPLFVVMPFAWGWLAGPSGLLAITTAIGFGTLLGLEVGRRGIPGALALIAIAIGLAWANGASISARELPAQLVAPQPVPGFPEKRVAIIGIDGADFQVLSPMIERGALPNLADLMARGRQGTLRSIEPTLSPVVWTTIFSGHPADIHGLRSWSTSDNRNRRVPMLWDLFGAHDLRSLVVNVPGTWPPAQVEQGRVLSGFPIPGIVSGGRGQLIGTVLSSVDGEEGPVTTVRAREIGEGVFALDLPIAAPLLQPRFAGVSHVLIDAATQDRQIPVAKDRFIGTARFASDRVELDADVLGKPVDLPLDTWSDWIRFEVSDGFAYLRARVLDAGPDRMRIYLTPAFQNPEDPRYGFTSNLDTELLTGLGAPYVVEGVGWRAHRDDRVAALLPAALADIERVHADAALALIEQDEPDLFAYAVTLTDRIQHPFWRDHEPAAFEPGFGPHAGLDGRDPVEDAYRTADTLLGKFLAALSRDTLVFVVSDHGVAPAHEKGEGGHRVEGIWIAAGPGIEPTEDFEELSILDIVPTVLHCMGAPAAEDMPGRVALRLCPNSGVENRIASYRSVTRADNDMSDAENLEIDASREEQLRSLGYIE